MKCALNAYLSTLRVSKTGSMLMFIKTSYSLLMGSMKFAHMLHDLSSTKLSQLKTKMETFVPDG
jgi:hypothetical protein